MNIETTTVRARTYRPSDSTMEDYLHFGWVHTQDTESRSGRGRGHRHVEHILVRDKDMPDYISIRQLENEYFNLKSMKKAYVPMEAGNVLLAFVFLIIPGIIYVAAKLTQKKKIEEHNADIQRRMDELASKARTLLR